MPVSPQHQSANMGFDTMGSYQRLMIATYMHDDVKDVSQTVVAMERSDSSQSTDGFRVRDDLSPKTHWTSTNDSMATFSRPSPITLSAPSFRQATSGWSPPLSPRSKSPGSPPSMTFRDSVASVADSAPPTPVSAKERNALAIKLYSAACTGDLDTIRLLLSIGVPVDASTLVQGLFDSFKPAKPGHLTPLAGAASSGQFGAVRLLVANGALINPNCNQSASSPLHQACRNNDMQTTRFLLDSGADIDILNSYNATPLMYAVKYSSPDLVSLILSFKPDLNKLSFIGAAALHWSMWPSYPESTELLLLAGSNPDMTMLDGNSALHCAALSCSPDKVQCLLKYGANPHIRNADNMTPYQTAVEAGAEDIAQILRMAMFRR